MTREVELARATRCVSVRGGRVHLRDIDQGGHRPDCGAIRGEFILTDLPLSCTRCVEAHATRVEQARRCEPGQVRADLVRRLDWFTASIRKDLEHLVAFDLAWNRATEVGPEVGGLAARMAQIANVLDVAAVTVAERRFVELYEDNAGGLFIVHGDQAWALPGRVVDGSGFADDALSWLDGSWHPRDTDGAELVDLAGLRAQTERDADATVLVAVFEDGIVYQVGKAGAAAEQYVSYGACGGTRQCSLNDSCGRRNPLGDRKCH